MCRYDHDFTGGHKHILFLRSGNVKSYLYGCRIICHRLRLLSAPLIQQSPVYKIMRVLGIFLYGLSHVRRVMLTRVKLSPLSVVVVLNLPCFFLCLCSKKRACSLRLRCWGPSAVFCHSLLWPEKRSFFCCD